MPSYSLPPLSRRCRWQKFFLIALAGLVSFGLSLGSPVIAQPVPDGSTPAPTAPANLAPVTLGDATLFTLQEKQSNDSIEERVERISDRLEEVARDETVAVEEIALSESELGTAIYSKDGLIMVVSDADSATAGLPRQALAEQYLGIMQAQIQVYRTERSAEYLSRAVVIAVLCTLGLVLAILVLANVMPQFYRWLDRQQDRWVPDVRIQNFELLTAHQLTTLVEGFTKILHFALVTTLILSYLSYVLSLFPQTRQLGQSVFDHVWGAWQIVWAGFVAYLPNLLSITLIVFLTATALRLARWLFSNIRRGRLRIPGFYPEWALPTYRLVQFLAFAFALAVIFPYLPGANSPAFQGVSIFFGLLVSLGAGGVIFSVVAGFILVYTRAFAEGDRIRFGDTEGFVTEKSLLVTRIRTVENILVSVPNSALLSNNIINYSALIREQQLPITLKTTITLGYDVPWRLVHETLVAAAEATSYILKEPQPCVWQTSLDDFYVSYQLRACTLHPEVMLATYSELHQNLQDYCNQAGIEILSPHYGAMRDGNQSTIPANYLPTQYKAPFWNLPAFFTSPPGGQAVPEDGHPQGKD